MDTTNRVGMEIFIGVACEVAGLKVIVIITSRSVMMQSYQVIFMIEI